MAGLLDVLAGGYARSRVLETKGANLVSGTYAPGGKAAYMVKDLSIVAAEARRAGIAVQQAALSLDTYAAVADAGLGEQDMSVVYGLIRDRRTPTSPMETADVDQ